jgi:phenylalanyl-tRNA synthetase beta chain
MQISLKWVNELVNIEKINLDDLIEKLTLGGFEVEEIINIEIDNNKEISLDISATANRSDSLSIQGISTEIATLLDQPNKYLNYYNKITNWKEKIQELSVDNLNKTNCSSFIALKISNLTNFTSPIWLKNKLISSGIKPENNLLDFKNYILLETGYPFEFYDYNKICSKLKSSSFTLSISPSTTEKEFHASNNNIYNLDNSILLIRANNIPISIAGIIESQDFLYSSETSTLLIEASIFNSSKIRQQSRVLGIRTDRSARYEKSLKDTYLVESLYRLINLLKISNPNLVCHFNTGFKFIEEPKEPILLRYKTICEILGPITSSTHNNLLYIKIEDITSYLKRLNFDFSYNTSEISWLVKIPHNRSEDIKREIDLIEEIGRLHGFNNFLIRLPKIKKIGKKDSSYKIRKKITQSFLNLGFNELIHYSLVNEKTFLENEVQLINPLVSDYSNLKVSLLPNLIKTVKENFKQGTLFLEGFEYGHVFFKNNSNKFNEKECVAGVFGGIKTKLSWSQSESPLSWFEAKGKMEQFFNQLNIKVDWKENSIESFKNFLHPFRIAELYLENKEKLGIFGQINPLLANQLDITSEIYLFELDIEKIQTEINKNTISISKDYSSYPKITKDISFIINKKVTFKEISDILYFNGTKFLTDINLIDEYRGPSIPSNCTSLCLELVFQSNEKTLESKNIDIIINNLENLLFEKFNILIRK